MNGGQRTDELSRASTASGETPLCGPPTLALSVAHSRRTAPRRTAPCAHQETTLLRSTRDLRPRSVSTDSHHSIPKIARASRRGILVHLPKSALSSRVQRGPSIPLLFDPCAAVQRRIAGQLV